MQQNGRQASRPTLNKTRQILAGEEGLEPSHAGIKIQCLNQLGDSPTPVSSIYLPTIKLNLNLILNSILNPTVAH